MASLNAVVRFLNRGLRTREIRDRSRNGLQVRGPQEVRVVGFAVDAALATFEQARKRGVDLLIVHHGLLWKGQRDAAGMRARRIAFLKKYRISLYASHLPLDLHRTVGNNIILARMLGLDGIKPFGTYKGEMVGMCGRWRRPRTLRTVAAILDRHLKTRCRLLRFGPSAVRSAGIVSGGGGSLVMESVQRKLDCFITGEAGHVIYHEAKELRQNVVIAGHYATETVGVRALMPILRERFGVRTLFIDVSTGM